MTGQLARLCEFCGGPIPEGSRRDAVTCSQPCRQKRNRWRVGRAPEPSRGSVAGRSRRDGSPPGERDGSAPGARDALAVSSHDCPDCAAAVSDGYDACDAHAGAAAPREDRPLRLAYADPPYPNLSRRYYGREEVDHRELIERLDREYDGWALSTSSAALPMVLKLCPDTVRVCIWLRRPRAGRCWEPVIVKSGRKITSNRDTHLIPPDVLDDPSVFRGYPGRIVGMKSPAFCEWVFLLMGAQLGDSLDDVFPGTGAVSRAWRLFQAPASERPKTAKPSRLAEKLGGATTPTKKRRASTPADPSRRASPKRRAAPARTSSAKRAKSSPPTKPATKRAGGKGGRPTRGTCGKPHPKRAGVFCDEKPLHTWEHANNKGPERDWWPLDADDEAKVDARIRAEDEREEQLGARPPAKMKKPKCPEHGVSAYGGGTWSGSYRVEHLSCRCEYEVSASGGFYQWLGARPKKRSVCNRPNPEDPKQLCVHPRGHVCAHDALIREKKPGEHPLVVTTITWKNNGEDIEELELAEPSRSRRAKKARSGKRRPAPAPDLPASATDAELRERRAFDARTAELRRELELETSRAAETPVTVAVPVRPRDGGAHLSRGDRREGAA